MSKIITVGDLHDYLCGVYDRAAESFTPLARFSAWLNKPIESEGHNDAVKALIIESQKDWSFEKRVKERALIEWRIANPDYAPDDLPDDDFLAKVRNEMMIEEKKSINFSNSVGPR